MSDHDTAPDPIDQAYARAEAALSDDAARAARRARVLAAIASEPVTPPATALAPMRRSVWRRGGWLAAASVAGLGLFAVTQVYHPIPRQPQVASTAPAAGIPQASVGAKPAGPSTPSSPKSAAPQALAAAPAPAPTASPVEVLPATPPAPSLAIPPPAPRAFPAEAPAPPPPPIVAAQGRDAPADAADDMQQRSGGAADEALESRRAAKQAPMAAFAAPSTRSEAAAAPPSDPAAGLRAAAAAGRTADVRALLAQGVPVDAPDVDGDTALMKSIQGDHVATAALLRWHGASLDRENHAGARARDMAAAKGDADLNQAVGLVP